MGTVHAKAHSTDLDKIPANTGYDMFPEEDVQPEKPTVKLDEVKARVDKVHVDGLSRTKDDIVRHTIADLFEATNFEDVMIRAQKVRGKLDSMGCFKNIGIYIDVSSGPNATPEGLEVTFQVNELGRVVGGINTSIGDNEGSLVVGMKMPNVYGRGESVQTEYSMGYNKNSNFSVRLAKPLPLKTFSPTVSTSVFQQNHQMPWSGYKTLDRGVLLDIAFKTSEATKHNLQWESLIRDTSLMSRSVSFKVRESCGPRMKSALRHIVSVDHRDDGIFPTRGSLLQFTSEVAGLGGNVAFLKNELAGQANVKIGPDVVVQASGQFGVLHDLYGTDMTEHFYLGGPLSLRGFKQRGVGPQNEGNATGGRLYWATGLHVFAPLPFRPGAGGIGELFRSHFFVNAGSLAAPAENISTMLESMAGSARVSCGAGVAVRVGNVARFELNYCVPLIAMPSDVTARGLQFGIGVNFL